MPGSHVNDQQVRIYMRLRIDHMQVTAAAIGLRPIPRRYRVRGQGGEAASGEEVKGFWVRTTAWA